MPMHRHVYVLMSYMQTYTHIHPFTRIDLVCADVIHTHTHKHIHSHELACACADAILTHVCVYMYMSIHSENIYIHTNILK
jgi:hypothetical protein